MADVQILAPGTVSSPLDYVIPGAQEILIKGIRATFDGTGAGGSFVPTLQFIAPGGKFAIDCPLDVTLAAGASADCNWFPGVKSSTASGSLAIDHNGANVGTEPVLDFEDSGTVTFTVTDTPTVKVAVSATAAGGGGGSPAGAYAVINAVNNVASAATPITPDFGATVILSPIETNDSSTFTLDAVSGTGGPFDGMHGLGIHTPGAYMVVANVQLSGSSATPWADKMFDLTWQGFLGQNIELVGGSNYTDDENFAGVHHGGGTAAIWNRTVTQLIIVTADTAHLPLTFNIDNPSGNSVNYAFSLTCFSMAGNGIQFDKAPQSGDWLEIETTSIGGPANVGIHLNDTDTTNGGIEVDSVSPFGIDINQSYTSGAGTNKGGIFLTANGDRNSGLVVHAAGTNNGGVAMNTSGTNNGGIGLGDSGGAGITLSTSGSGTSFLYIFNLPVADPHISGAIWSNAGVLTVSP